MGGIRKSATYASYMGGITESANGLSIMIMSMS